MVRISSISARWTWLATWEDEVTGFPKSAHDDQVDTLSMLALYIYRWNEPLIEVWGDRK